MFKFKVFFPLIIYGVILVLVVLKIEPPKNFASISFPQAILFFLPLFLFLFFFINLLVHFFLWSVVLSLEIIILLILQALGFLNPLTLILNLAAVILLLKSLKRPKRFHLKNLSYSAKIPKLTKLKRQR